MKIKEKNELQYIDNLLIICLYSMILSAVLLIINIYFI